MLIEPVAGSEEWVATEFAHPQFLGVTLVVYKGLLVIYKGAREVGTMEGDCWLIC